MLKRDDGDLECCSYRGCSFVEEWFAVENSGLRVHKNESNLRIQFR